MAQVNHIFVRNMTKREYINSLVGQLNPCGPDTDACEPDVLCFNSGQRLRYKADNFTIEKTLSV